MEIITRKEAKEKGLKRFFTGIPCKRGGISERFTSNGVCQCNLCLNVKSVIDKRYGEVNKDDIRQRSKDRMTYIKETNYNGYLDLRRNHYARNKEKYKNYRTTYDLKNKNKVTGWSENRKYMYEKSKVWFLELDEFVEQQAKILAKDRTSATGLRWSIDHMIPIMAKTVCGLTVWNNIQVIPLSLNSHKRNKMICTEINEWISYINSGDLQTLI